MNEDYKTRKANERKERELLGKFIESEKGKEILERIREKSKEVKNTDDFISVLLGATAKEKGLCKDIEVARKEFYDEFDKFKEQRGE